MKTFPLRQQPFQFLYLCLIYFFLYFPMAVIILFSFNDAVHSLVWHGFTTRWYQELWADHDLLVIAAHSFIIATLSACVATLLGTVAAVSLYRYRFLGRQWLHGLVFILIVIPDLVTGISLILIFNLLHFPFGFTSLLIAHITLGTPFVCVTVSSQLNQLDKYLIEAARDLGASENVLLRKILVPLLLPSVLSGWLLSFTLSLDDVIVSYFVSGPDYMILPLRIYSMVKLGVKPEVNALCTVLLSLTLVIAVTAQRLTRERPS